MSTLTITLVQTALAWGDKEANLRVIGEKINNIREKTELIVLPEMFTTGFNMDAVGLGENMNGPSVQWMKETAAKRKVIVTGSLIIEEEGLYYNRLIWMLPNGQMGVYDKRHCFSYAGEDKYFTPGTKRLIASVKGWRVNLMVCYDLRFPVWSRQIIAKENEDPSPEYDVLIYVANWPDRRNLAWKTLLRARAIENQCYVVGVNRIGEDGNGVYYSGDSMVIDPLGEILYEKAHLEELYTITLDKNRLDEIRSKFAFWKDADRFLII